MTSQVGPLRSALYMPAANERALEKAKSKVQRNATRSFFSKVGSLAR